MRIIYPHNKHYLTFDTAMKQRFGHKMIKLCLNAGFTCPNRDGTAGTGGCIYCTASGSGDFAGTPTQSITEQLRTEAKRMQNKWPDEHYIAYFQANTNTYTTPEHLLSLCREAAAFPGVEAISIATRPDCLPPEMINCLQTISEQIPLFLELGLQTVFDKTAERIHRGYPFETFLSGYAALCAKQIPVTIHLINGLPGESPRKCLPQRRQSPHFVRLVSNCTCFMSWKIHRSPYNIMQIRFHCYQKKNMLRSSVSKTLDSIRIQ